MFFLKKLANILAHYLYYNYPGFFGHLPGVCTFIP